MRSPLGALAALRNKAPVPYVSRGIRQALLHGGRSGAEAQMRAMGNVGTLFAIVHRTSNAASQVEWKLWRTATSGRDEDRVEVTSHLALDIWRKPNPFMTRQEYVESVQQHVDLTGEGWWVVARDPRMRSIPLELWPVRPDRMEPIPDRDEFLAGYEYVSPDGERVPLRLDEVIQLRMPNPLDPYRGMGPVQSILTELDSTRYSAEWNRNFFRNSALPSGIIEAPTNLSDQEFDDLRDRWEEQHRGVAAAHRVAILEGGLKWVDRKFTQRDMQFAELRAVSRDVIREAFGMPKFAVGDVEDVNRASAEASKAWFAEMLTVPRLERFKGALNADFLPLFGATAEGLEFDYEDPVPQDAEARDRERTSKAQAAKLYREAGYTGDSVKEALELPDTLVWEAPTPPDPAPPIPPVAPAARVQPRAAAPLVLGQDTPEEIREDWQDRLEDLLADWDSVSAAQRRELVDQITAAIDDGRIEDLAKLTASSSAGAASLEAAMVAQAEAAGARMVETADAQGVAIEAAAVTGVLAAALAAAAAVTAALLAAGLAVAAGREALRIRAPGASGSQVAQQVREHLEQLSDATLRTELGGAIWSAENAGRFATLEAAEADGKGPTWYEASESRDKNTCAPCADIDGQRFDLYDEARSHYPNGGYFICLGGIRCRGTVEPHWGGS